MVRVSVACTACDYMEERTMKEKDVPSFDQDVVGQACPKCSAPSLQVAEVKDVIEDFAELAEHVGSDVEVISVETEEGQMLKKSFGGVAAVLRFKPSG